MVNHKWERIQTDVRKIKDALGMPVDEGIFETVAVFKYLGINTTASCAGHIDRITGGPYVIFQSHDNHQLLTELKSIGDRKKPEYKEILHQIIRNNISEVRRILPYLKSFYSNRIVDYNQRIILDRSNILNNCISCQGADLAYDLTENERVELLKLNQTEIKAFIDHIKTQLELN